LRHSRKVKIRYNDYPCTKKEHLEEERERECTLLLQNNPTIMMYPTLQYIVKRGTLYQETNEDAVWENRESMQT
jgi:hypothetical protein